MANLPDENIQVRSGFIFPDMENISYEEKQKPSYFLKVVKAIYSAYTNNTCDLPYSGPNTTLDSYVDNLRTIAHGRQGPEFYKDILLGGEVKIPNLMSDNDVEMDKVADASRKGWMIGYWDTLNPMQHIITKCLGELYKYDTDIKAFCTNIDANDNELLSFHKEWVDNNPSTSGVLNLLRSSAGIPQQKSMGLTYEQLSDIRFEGGFKESYINGIEQIISHTADISNWVELKEKLFKDLFEIGCTWAFLDHNYTTNKVEWKYLDLKDVIQQISSYKNSSDAQFFGWITYLSLNKIREVQDMVWNGTGFGLTPDDLSQIATKYKTYLNNDKSQWDSNKNYNPNESIDVTTCVVNMRWLDVEKIKKSEYKGKLIEYKPGHEKNKSYTVSETRQIKVYECKWLLGTDFIWDYGCMPNQMFINEEPSLGYAMFKLQEKSMLERVIPLIHLYAISFLKAVNSMAKSQDDFYDINAEALAMFADGDKKYDPLDMLRFLRQENAFIHYGNANTGGDGSAIKKIDGTSLEDFQKHFVMMEMYMKQIEVMTGISAISLGQTPEARVGVRTTLASMNASNTAMSYIYNCIMEMKSKLSEQTIQMATNLLEVDDKAKESYSMVIGKELVSDIIDNVHNVSTLGIKMYPQPTDDMKEDIKNYLQYAIQQGAIDGAMALRTQYQLYRGGNFYQVIYKLEYLIKEEQKRQKAEKEAMIDRQTEGNKQAAQVQAESQQAIEQAKMQSDNNLENKKTINTLMASDNQFANDMKKIVMEDMTSKGEDPTQILADFQALVDKRKQQLMQAV